MNRGVLLAIGTYSIWGLLPIYWKALETVPAVQILGHRIVWSFIVLLALILFKREWGIFRLNISSRRLMLIFGLSGCLLAANWLIYIWGVNSGFILETSLGYFINPLVSVLLGVIFLREKLRPLQWLPIGLAAAGVLYLAFSYGSFPWISMALAFSFGFYGLIKKTAPLGALHGLALETAFLFFPAGLFLLTAEGAGNGMFGHLGLLPDALLALSGLVTALPLLMFASAVRSIPLSTLGFLQYLSPTCQFLLGVLVYAEPFTLTRFAGFAIIWSALLIFTLEGILARRAGMSPSYTD